MTLCAVYTSPDGETEIEVRKLPSGLTTRAIGQWRDDTVPASMAFPAAWGWLDALVEEGWMITIYTTGNEAVDDDFERVYDQINADYATAAATAPAGTFGARAAGFRAQYAAADEARETAYLLNRSALLV